MLLVILKDNNINPMSSIYEVYVDVTPWLAPEI